MKKSMITLAIALFTLTAYSGVGDFNRTMKTNLNELRAYDEKSDYEKLSKSFLNIANDNPDRYEPLYYSAYIDILQSWNIQNSDSKLIVLKRAMESIQKAKELSSENDEILVIEAFCYQAMIMVNPREYGQSYSMKAAQLLKQAQVINSSNPRAQFLLAQNIYYTPKEYGGGKEKALPLFEKSAKLFESQETDNFLNPVWGEYTNKQMINKCSSK